MTVLEAASDEEVAALLGLLQQLEPQLQTWLLPKADLHLFPQLAAVLEAHFVVTSDYSLQFFKRAGCSCPACARGLIKPPRLDAAQFAALAPCPLPLLAPAAADGEVHYQAFAALVGTVPDSKDQPSKAAAAAGGGGRSASSMALGKKQYVRAQIMCADCGKPRMVYAKEAMPAADWAAAAAALEDRRGEFICGEPLFAPDHPCAAAAGNRQMVVNEELECSSHVEMPYYNYAATNKNPRADDLLCSVCAAKTGARPEELVAKFKSVAPICDSCVAQGHTAAFSNTLPKAARAAAAASQGTTTEEQRKKQRIDALAKVATAKATQASQQQPRARRPPRRAAEAEAEEGQEEGEEEAPDGWDSDKSQD